MCLRCLSRGLLLFYRIGCLGISRQRTRDWRDSIMVASFDHTMRMFCHGVPIRAEYLFGTPRMTILAIIVLVLMVLCGAPLFSVILAGAIFGYLASDIGLSVIAAELLRLTNTPLLVALPLFTFTGYLLAASDTTQRLLLLIRALFGWLPGGMAIVGFLLCAVFTALTGASGVTIVALGAILFPMLLKAGYSEKFSLGHITTSGSLGLLLVPSIPLILYGIIAQQLDVGEKFAVKDLFVAGFVPFMLMVLALSLWTVFRHRELPTARISLQALWQAVKKCKWELPLPFFILGGIYAGFITISEVAAITALYVLIVEVFVYKEVAFKKLPGVIQESMVMVGSIILILGSALALTNYFVDIQVAQKMFTFVNEHISNPLVFLMLLNIFLLLVGALLDIFSAIVILVPLLLPVAVGYGIHPVHLGIILIANLQIGYFTPPVGMNLFIASYRFKRSILDLYVSTIPFMLILLAVLMLITYVPFFSTWYQYF